MTTTLQSRLKEAMRLAGVRQADLARACGVAQPSVSDWVTGKTKALEGQNLVRAAKRLRVNPEWLATGKGSRELLSDGDGNVRVSLGGLGETVTSDLPSPPSQSLTLDPHILVEAEKWVLFEEGAAGKPYGLLPRAERISALYGLIQADGGTLSPANAASLIESARARATQGESQGVRSRIAGRSRTTQ